MVDNIRQNISYGFFGVSDIFEIVGQKEINSATRAVLGVSHSFGHKGQVIISYLIVYKNIFFLSGEQLKKVAKNFQERQGSFQLPIKTTPAFIMMLQFFQDSPGVDLA